MSPANGGSSSFFFVPVPCFPDEEVACKVARLDGGGGVLDGKMMLSCSFDVNRYMKTHKHACFHVCTCISTLSTGTGLL